MAEHGECMQAQLVLVHAQWLLMALSPTEPCMCLAYDCLATTNLKHLGLDMKGSQGSFTGARADLARALVLSAQVLYPRSA